MPHKERIYRDSAGKVFVLKSVRTITAANQGWDGVGWIISLKLYRKRPIAKKLIASRFTRKSGRWSTSAIELIQAQEEKELLATVGINLTVPEILRAN